MKRSTLTKTSNNNELLTSFPTFQTDLDWYQSQREFERGVEEFIKETQIWVENAERDIKKMKEEYDSRTYYEDGWKIIEVKSKNQQSVLRMKTKITDGANLMITDYMHNGKKVYHSEKIEGVPRRSYSSNITVEKDSSGCGGCCLGTILICLGIFAIIILAILGIIKLF